MANFLTSDTISRKFLYFLNVLDEKWGTASEPREKVIENAFGDKVKPSTRYASLLILAYSLALPATILPIVIVPSVMFLDKTISLIITIIISSICYSFYAVGIWIGLRTLNTFFFTRKWEKNGSPKNIYAQKKHSFFNYDYMIAIIFALTFNYFFFTNQIIPTWY